MTATTGDRFDVLVVGAGPAGSTAARECAALGLSTAILDRARFPRDKPCGGGVTARAAALLPFDLSVVVEREVRQVRFSWRGAVQFTRGSKQPLVLMTQRARLDAFLVDRAVEAGARLLQGCRVETVVPDDHEVVVEAGGRVFRASVVIGADGVNGPTARLVGLRDRATRGIALEGNFPLGPEAASRWDGVMAFDFGDARGGYGWVFPKGDHVNVGVGGWLSTAPVLRLKMTELARRYGFDLASVWGVRGHHLPVRSDRSPMGLGRVLLVGDAAGLVDPLTGEGIYSAIYSGRAAARAAADFVGGRAPDLSGYRRELERQLLPDLAAGRYMHGLFHLMPGFFFGVIGRSERPWRLVRGFLTGERTYTYVRRRLGALWPVARVVATLIVLRPGFRRT